MPVYHFTLHAYRSWRPDHPRGYVRRKQGVLPPDPAQAAAYDRRAKGDQVVFGEPIQCVLIRGAHEICARRNWRLHGVGTERGHAHFAISWRGVVRCQEVMQKLKNVLSLLLGREIGPPGKRWFVRSGSRRRVHDRAHLAHLLDVYFPDHPGLCWREGQPLP